MARIADAPAPPKKSSRKGDDEKGRGGGGFIIIVPRHARLKSAWRGSARIATRPGRAIVGLFNAAARALNEIARELQRHLIRAHPLEIARQQREAEARAAEDQAKADQAELAAIDEEFQKWLEEQRRRMMEAAAQHPGNWRPWHTDAAAATFANAAKATAIPLSVQRLIRFSMPANDGTEAMHTDARYRDTLGTASTLDTASSAGIAPEISDPPPKISGPSLNL